MCSVPTEENKVMYRFLRALVACSLVIFAWEALLRPQLVGRTSAQNAKNMPADNEELKRLYTEDQADRMPKDGKSIDWKLVGPRDEQRLKRVHEIYKANGMSTGPDYYHVAMVLQHSHIPEDFLLAHELCVVAIGKGHAPAKWLAAASEDRFLMNINRPQRFGTQFRADQNKNGGAFYLYKVDEGVTDELRRAFNTPTLQKARDREAEMNEKPKPVK
jgi:hypothetical protein